MTEEHDDWSPPLGWDPDEDEDAALARLEDVLLAAPDDRALPDLDVILARAKYPAELLRRDERALKLLNEALLARPLSSPEEVTATRTHLELMTLEVEVLTARLTEPDVERAVIDRSRERLGVLRDELEDIRRKL
jgi:hypothetical protein